MFEEISCQIKEIKDGKAILVLEDGQEIFWPLDKIPFKIENKNLKLILTTEEIFSKERAELAKKILEEILNEK